MGERARDLSPAQSEGRHRPDAEQHRGRAPAGAAIRPARTERFEEALALWRDLGRRRDSAVALDSLAALRFGRGDLAARPAAERRGAGDLRGRRRQIACRVRLGKIALILRAQGDLDGARRPAGAGAGRTGADRREDGRRPHRAGPREDRAGAASRRGSGSVGPHRGDEFRTQKLSSDEAGRSAAGGGSFSSNASSTTHDRRYAGPPS